MEKIFEILTDFKDEEDVRDLWDEIFRYTNDNKYSAHNLIVGFPKNGDTILWQQLVSKQSNTMGWHKHTITYPPENCTNPGKAIITGIAVIDVKNDGNGGTPEIKSGGVGSEFASIRLTAEFWRGISFQVIIIGRYLKNNNEVINNLNVDKNEKESKDRKINFNFNLNE